MHNLEEDQRRQRRQTVRGCWVPDGRQWHASRGQEVKVPREMVQGEETQQPTIMRRAEVVAVAPVDKRRWRYRCWCTRIRRGVLGAAAVAAAAASRSSAALSLTVVPRRQNSSFTTIASSLPLQTLSAAVIISAGC